MISTSDILHGKVLIVDDQEANILLLERVLGGAGYDSIMSTRDPTEVCELHLKNHYDLILLDLQMPILDGFQVMERLKEIEPGGYLPVLVITAQPGHKLRALQAGARDFISKPFELPEVLARVHNMLEVRLLHNELHNHNDALEQRVRRTLGAEAEGVISASSLVTGAPSSIYGILANADLPWPTIKLSDGTTARLDQSGYTKWRAGPNRADRQAVSPVRV